MKNLLKYTILALSIAIILTGCTTSKSYTFKVETGDNIKVELKTNENYNIDSNIPFNITKVDEKVTQGTFALSSAYEEYSKALENDTNAKLIEKDSKNGLEYIFYSYNNTNGFTEYNYIIKISNSCVILNNIISKESAKEIFDRLTITKE